MMQFEKLLNEYDTTKTVILEAKNDPFETVKENKEIRIRKLFFAKKIIKKRYEFINPTTHAKNVLGKGRFIPVKVNESSADD